MEQAEETQAKRNRQGSQPVLPARQSKVPFDPLLLTYFQRLLLCCVWRCGWRQFRCWEIFTLCVAHRAQPPPQACGRHHGRALPEVRWDATADSSERPQCAPSTQTRLPDPGVLRGSLPGPGHTVGPSAPMVTSFQAPLYEGHLICT